PFPTRRSSDLQVRDPERQVMRFELPGWMAGRQFVRRFSPACFNGRRSRQSFQAISVVRTVAGERIALKVMRNAKMTHFRVRTNMQHTAVHDGAATQTG